MRRRLESFIPIVLFAVLVQLLAPIGAFRAAASSAGDPLAMAAICSGMTPDSHGQTTPADLPASHCCTLCAYAQGGSATPPVMAPAFVPQHPEFQRVAWAERGSMAAAVRTGSNRQARAPPTLT